MKDFFGANEMPIGAKAKHRLAAKGEISIKRKCVIDPSRHCFSIQKLFQFKYQGFRIFLQSAFK